MKWAARIAASLVLFGALPAWTQGHERTEQGTARSSFTSTAPQTETPREAAEGRANLLMTRKMYSEAIAAYLELLKEEPRNVFLLNQVGIAYQQQMNFREASRYYHRALKVDKNYATALNNLGTVEYSSHKYRKAIHYYEKALKIRSDEATFYSNLGYAWLDDKQYSRALAAFHRALELDPLHFEHRGVGGSLVSQRSSSDPGFFYFLLAKSYALTGNAERCAHYLKMARDEGYKKLAEANNDPAFERVRQDPRVREFLEPSPIASVPDSTN